MLSMALLAKNVNSLQGFNVSMVIDNLLNGYDRRLRPNYGGDPVDVKVSMYVISVSSLSEADMEFTLDFYFRTHWNDPRLRFEKRQGLEELSLGHDFGKSIWLPDLFFVQDRKDSFMHTLTSKNEFLSVDYNGNVKRSVRLSVTAGCPMNFINFPLDTQRCALDIESYGSNTKGMKLNWKEPVGFSSDMSVDVFEFIGLNQTEEFMYLSSANYSRLNVEFEFKRLSGYYIRQIYIPCLMLVILSWISFWLNRRAFNVRLVITAVSLLILSIGLNIVGFEIPKTNYNKAIDIFTGVSMTFVFVALVQFAYLANFSADNDKDFPEKIDMIFRIAYPALFILFNIFYWALY